MADEVSKNLVDRTDVENRGDDVEVSVVIPLFNEEQVIDEVLGELLRFLTEYGRLSEVVCVDDGSTDATVERVGRFIAEDPRVCCIRLSRNYGQTAALMAGVAQSSGKVIVTMDGDGQYDPSDIGILMEKIDEGFDVVSGWRRKRNDSLPRVLLSRIANGIASRVAGVRLHDFGCTLKAYRRDVVAELRLYGELHRFVPIFSSWHGGKVVELAVNHRRRSAGQSKYGYGRIFRVLLDLILIRYLHMYMHRPIHVFGGIGLLFMLGGFGCGCYAVWLKFVEGISFILTPLPLLTVTLIGIGTTSVMAGLLAEVVVRTYYESQGRRPFIVKEVLTFEAFE